MLTYSRIDREALPFESVALNEVINNVLDDLALKVEANQARIEVEQLGRIEADPVQMGQLFLNLIGNSLKYRNPEQTPLIRIRRQVDQEGPEHHDELRLSIQDNGMGFEQRYAEQIFDMFQRLPSEEAIQGSGIGLSICKKILERHHGRISARSKPSQGTEFLIVLPRSQQAAAPS